MTENELNEEYFGWLCQIVQQDNRYRQLLNYLYTTDFTYTIAMDANRAEDGIGLRYRFGDECGYGQPTVATLLDDRPCSILEMMVALAIRCENIMSNPEYGDRTSLWFWEMINNLGVSGMTDNRFDELFVEAVMERLLKREYRRNGYGGLFTIHNCAGRDLRTVEIWYQMCWYLDEII